MRWGLVPSWAKAPSIGACMINARAETIGEKPSFRTALRRRRCLVLADGFYECQRVPGSRAKRPMRIVLQTGEPFAFAGLWETWRNPAGQTILSCTIITTEANRLLAPHPPPVPVLPSQDPRNLLLAASALRQGKGTAVPNRPAPEAVRSQPLGHLPPKQGRLHPNRRFRGRKILCQIETIAKP